jgi:conjugal transfer pilus assembly protein TrbC
MMRKFLFYILMIISFQIQALDHASIRNISEQAMLYQKDIERIISSLKQDESVKTHLKKVSNVLVFLSFSMPEQSLETWLLQCKQSGATPVIRGLIDNSFKKTVQALQNLSKKTGLGVQVDPILFKTFAIEQVPAVAYVAEIPDCPLNMNCLPARYSKIYGDISLDYALEKMQTDENKQELDKPIKRLRGGL